MPLPDPPTGSVTMLFTDIEGSTRLARTMGEYWPEVLNAHQSIVVRAIRDAGGYVENAEGDGFFAGFVDADSALRAARTAQKSLGAYAWPQEIGVLRVRMGLHTANVDRVNGQYVGLEVHRAARVGASAHGGQIILTKATRSALSIPVACEDLGAHRLKDFPEPTHLFHVSADGRSARELPPPSTLDVRPTNLPPMSTPVLGRDAEIRFVKRALGGSARIVTITGLGGAGKTTTALSAARSLLDRYPAGVWLVRGEALGDADDLVAAIAEALWLRDAPGADLRRLLLERLADGSFLLVLDNLEHIPGAPGVVADIVRSAPAVGVLATSRTPLHLPEEHVVRLGPLPLEHATELLLMRAEATGAAQDTSGPSRSAARELCERLDGLPLAIELVAPRLRLISPAELLEHLEPIGTIASATIDRPERHRSVRITVEWSVGLLSQPATDLFRRLAVFEGPCPIDVLEEVCCSAISSLEPLGELVDFSLVQRAPIGFGLATAVREVAADLLATSGEEQRLLRAHALAMETVAARIEGYDATEDSLRLERNLRPDLWKAMQWSRVADPHVHRRLVLGLGARWALSGQVRRTLDEIATALACSMERIDRAKLVRLQAYVFLIAGHLADAERAIEEAVNLAADADAAERGRVMVTLAQVHRTAGRGPQAAESARTAVAHFRHVADAPWLVRGLMELGISAAAAGDVAAAGRALDEAEQLVDHGNAHAVAMVHAGRAEWALANGDLRRAVTSAVESLADDDYTTWGVAALAHAFSRLGASAAAVEMGAMAVSMAREIGIDVEQLTQHGVSMSTAMSEARRDLSAGEAAEAERAGRQTPAGQRAVRARELASRALTQASTTRARR